MIILLILTWAYSKPIQLLAIIIQLLSYSWLFAINGLLHQASLSLTISWSLLKLWWCYPTISSSVIPFSSHLQSFPAWGSFQMSQFFTWGFKVLEFQLQHQSFHWTLRTDFLQNGLVGCPCSPRDSQESSPTPQFKSINFSVFSFVYSPTLISIHDYWKKHSLD